MTDREDLEPNISASERRRLLEVSDRLGRDRPTPRPAFRGDLRRLLLKGGSGSARQAAPRWRILVATYSGLGALLLAVAAIGLAGAGPFSA
jgi:hypothetical protein